MKDFGSLFSVKDFFNYYIAGWLWLACVILILLLFNVFGINLDPVGFLGTQADALGPVISAVFVVIFPYVVGFVTSPWCYEVAQNYRKTHGDAIKWVTGTTSGNSIEDKPAPKSSKEKGDVYKGHRLSSPAIEQVSNLTRATFPGLKRKTGNDPSLHFFYIRAYVMDKGGAAAEYARRTEDLMNFTESLLIPAPLFFALITLNLIQMFAKAVLPSTISLWLIISAIISALLMALLVYRKVFKTVAERHLGFREYWVKHVYRAFLVQDARTRAELTAKKKGKDDDATAEE